MKPVGWPAGLPDPEDPDFAARAAAWLLDIGPAEWRGSHLLREHPIVLAFRARHDVQARIEGARAAYAAARAELSDAVAPQVLAGFLAALEAEGAALVALEREVTLVEEALLGRRWRPRL